MPSIAFCRFAVFSLAFLGPAFLQAATAQQAPGVEYSTAHRDHTHAVEQTLSGTSGLSAKLAAHRTAVSLAVAPLFQAGTQDLISGYATSSGGALLLQRGAPEASAPTEAEFPTLAADGVIAPFGTAATAIELPVRPDLLIAQDMTGLAHIDIVAAQRGGSAVYFLAGKGEGTFAQPQAIALRGPVTALSTWRSADGSLLLVAGVQTGQNAYGLQFLTTDGTEQGFVPLEGAVTTLEPARLNEHGLDDLLITAGGRALLLDGASIAAGSPVFATLPASGALAATSGQFIWDKRPFGQVAVLSSDGAMHLFARAGLDSSDFTPEEKAVIRAHRSSMPEALLAHASPAGLGWSEIETVPGFGAAGQIRPILLHGRFTAGGSEDLAVLSGGRYMELSHSTVVEGGTRRSTPLLTIDSTSSGPVVAAVAARVSADSRLGVVTAESSTPQPFVSVPATHTTYYVNYLTDSNNTASGRCLSNLALNQAPLCSLRDAVALANADHGNTSASSVDKIMVPAGTYSISIQNSVANPNGDKNYHLNLDTNVNIVGAGCTTSSGVATSCSTIIDGGNHDKIFSGNSSNVNAAAVFAIFMSGMQLQNGTNSGNSYDTAGGLISFDTQGPGTLTLNSMVLNRGTEQGDTGGALATYNAGSPTLGNIEIDNSTISSNSASLATTEAPSGGGVAIVYNETLLLNNDIFNQNSSGYFGGGLYINADSSGTSSKTLSTVTFTSNTASLIGGGIYSYNGGTYTSVTANNNKVTGTDNTDVGGGLYFALQFNPLTVNYATVTGNSLPAGSAAGGAGIFVSGTSGSTTPALSLQYSRIVSNTGGLPSSTGLAMGNVGNTQSGTDALTATNNWWGCNTDPQTSGTSCNLAHSNFPNAQLTTSPFTTLTITLNSTTPAANSSITATGSLGQNSSGTVYTTAQDAAYNGLPATLVITKGDSSTVASSATALNASAQIQTSTTANVAGTGHATVTVDGFPVTSNNFTVVAADLIVTSAHSGNFKAGDTADTYTLTVANIGNGSTSGTVTLSDSLPAGFTATGLSGTGWTCTLGNLTCTRSDSLSASVTYPPVTLTVSIAATAAGTYSNAASISGGNEFNTNNDSASDSTIVVAPPTVSEAFSPTSVAPNANSTLTITLTNPGANAVSLTGVAVSETLPTGLRLTGTAFTNCTSGTASGASGGSTLSLTGGTIAVGASCVLTSTVASPSIGNYTATTGNVTSTNSNAGGTASATLAVAVTPTRVVFIAVAATSITAGGNAGTVQAALEDASGNVNTSDSSTAITLKVTGPSYSQTYSSTATNGVATFNLSSVPLTAAGSYTYTATSGTLTQATSTETVNPGATVALTVTGLTSFGAPGVSETATIRAIDSYGNTATGFTGTVTLTSTDALAAFAPASYSFTASDAGTHAFTVALGTAGTQSVTATSGSYAGSQTGLVVSDAILVVSPGGTLARFTDTGTATSPSGGYTGGGTPTVGAAIDFVGNVFSLNATGNRLVEFNKSGTAVSPTTGTSYSGGGLSTPNALAIDGNGSIWIGNSNGTVSQFSNAGAALSPTAGYSSVAGTAAPSGTLSGVAIDNSGNVWLANKTTSVVTEIIGGAAPVAPLTNAVTNLTLGTRP